MYKLKKTILRWMPGVARIALILGLLLASTPVTFAQSGEGTNRLFVPLIGNTLEEGGSVKVSDEVQLAPVEPAGPQPQPQEPLAAPNVEEPGSGDSELVVPSAVIQGTPSIDMKVLVIAADGNETDYPAVTAFLRQLGIPFTTILAAQTPLTENMLWDGVSRGYYQGVILITGNLGYFNANSGQWESAFDQAEWQTLWDYEALFGVRQVTAYTFPGGWPDHYGMSYAGYKDTTAAPLQATLTAAGQAIYPYLNASSPVTFKNAWVYLGSIFDAPNLTPLLTYSENGVDYPIASIYQYPSGRENLAVTAGGNPYLIHSLLLSYGTINWVTKGVFLGERHVYMDPQIDDLLIDSDMWDIQARSDLTGLLFRMSGDDFLAAIQWQNNLRATYPLASSVTLEWAYNGEGATNIWDYPDTLTPVVKQRQSEFWYVNHTYTHANLDSISRAAARTELNQNHNSATKTLKLTKYYKDSMVQPDISGLYNANFFRAAKDFGIKYMISDTSRVGWDNPSPNAGFYSQFQPSILIIPRRPTNLFYNLATPEEWVSEYNCFYDRSQVTNPNPCAGGQFVYWDGPLTYEQILDKESDMWLQYLLKWDMDPLMFHQANVYAYDGTNSLLGDLIEATIAKYSAMYNVPILGRSQHDIGLLMAQRMAYDASGVTATLVPCQTITVKTVKAAKIPVTGITYGASTEVYGGQPISYISLPANGSVTVPAPACQ